METTEMTFEEKIKKISSEIEQALSALVGHKVVHKKFGEGILQKIENEKAYVRFSDGSTKCLVGNDMFFDFFDRGVDELSEITAEILDLEKKLLAHVSDEEQRRKESARYNSSAGGFPYPHTLSPVASSSHILDNAKMPAISLSVDIDGYYQYLRQRGYAEWTPSSLPSTIWQYIAALDDIHRIENMSFAEMYENIDALVKLYGEGGAKEDLGRTAHSTWINALKRLQDFKEYVEKYMI